MSRALRLLVASFVCVAGTASAVSKNEAWDAALGVINESTTGDIASLFLTTKGVTESSFKLVRAFRGQSYSGQFTISGNNFYNVVATAYADKFRGGGPALNTMFGFPEPLMGGENRVDPFGNGYTIFSDIFNAGSSHDTFLGKVRYSNLYGLYFDGYDIRDVGNCAVGSTSGSNGLFGPGTTEVLAKKRADDQVDKMLGAWKNKMRDCNSFNKAVDNTTAPFLRAAYAAGIAQLRSENADPSGYMTFSPAIEFIDPPPPPGPTPPPDPADPATPPADPATNCSFIDIPCNLRRLFIPTPGFITDKIMGSSFGININLPVTVVNEWCVDIPLNGSAMPMCLNFAGLTISERGMDQWRFMIFWGTFLWLLSYLGVPFLGTRQSMGDAGKESALAPGRKESEEKAAYEKLRSDDSWKNP
jgi:hypothetical protein